MGAEATGADLSPGSGGQMGPSGSTRVNRLFFPPQNQPCSHMFFTSLRWFSKSDKSHPHREKHLLTRLLIYKLGVMVLSGVASAPERSDEWKRGGGGRGWDNRLNAFNKKKKKVMKHDENSQRQLHLSCGHMETPSPTCIGEFITAIRHVARIVIDFRPCVIFHCVESFSVF